MRWAMFVACACALLAHVSGAYAADARKPATHTIVIEGTKYTPDTVTVKRGDTVAWINKDPFPHTATAKGSFDSASIAAGRTWKWKAGKAGDYHYICTLHPNMTGTIKVE